MPYIIFYHHSESFYPITDSEVVILINDNRLGINRKNIIFEKQKKIKSYER